MAARTLTQSFLREAVEYRPDTGEFFWRSSRPKHHFRTEHGRNIWHSQFAGKPAGSPDVSGYRRIYLLGSLHRAARLAYLYMQGEWPKVIDHINGDPTDDRWENLRNVSQRRNSLNVKRKKNNTSGFNGVWYCRRGDLWNAEIKVHGQKIFLGTFEDKDDAIRARKVADAMFGYTNGVRS